MISYYDPREEEAMIQHYDPKEESEMLERVSGLVERFIEEKKNESLRHQRATEEGE